jgi:hypothetical protein
MAVIQELQVVRRVQHDAVAEADGLVDLDSLLVGFLGEGYGVGPALGDEADISAETGPLHRRLPYAHARVVEAHAVGTHQVEVGFGGSFGEHLLQGDALLGIRFRKAGGEEMGRRHVLANAVLQDARGYRPRHSDNHQVHFAGHVHQAGVVFHAEGLDALYLLGVHLHGVQLPLELALATQPHVVAVTLVADHDDRLRIEGPLKLREVCFHLLLQSSLFSRR